MHFIFIFYFLLCFTATFGQIYPEYKVPVPTSVVLHHACMSGQIKQVFQSKYSNYDPESAEFELITHDQAGNLYITGYANFTRTQNPTITPLASPELTFNSLHANAVTHNRPDRHFFFLAKYRSNGEALWVKFMDQEPQKLVWNETQQELYILFHPTSYGITINEINHNTDSSYQSGNKVIFTFNGTDGSLKAKFLDRFIVDLYMDNDRVFLLYSRNISINNNEIRYGFFKTNAITKWQTALKGGTPVAPNLIYHPYQKLFWNTPNQRDYYRYQLHPTLDSIIAEDISRPLYHFLSPPYNSFTGIKNFTFSPDGGYLGEYHSTNTNGHVNPQLIKFDSTGKETWRLSFSYAHGPIGGYTYIIDPKGDMWISHGQYPYSAKIKIEPGNKEYFPSVEGKFSLPGCKLWHLNGSTGELKEALLNGYGNLNNIGDVSDYSGLPLLHVNANHHLITTPQLGAITYYPDLNGNYLPYFTSCTNQIIPSQFLWVALDLNNLISMDIPLQKDDVSKVFPTVYPNPSNGTFYLTSNQDEIYELYDIQGKKIRDYHLNGHDHQYISEPLPKGIYIIHGKYSHINHKMLIE